MKTLYQTRALAQAGRGGQVRTHDDSLTLDLALPKALGGTGRGNNPEELLAAGYAACFSNALLHVATKLGTRLEHAPVEARVALQAQDDGRFGFEIDLAVELADARAEEIVRLAHQTCPFSNAMRGNVATRLLLNGTQLEAQA